MSTEDEDRPEWLPEKFENPEAFARSYRELEQRFTQVAGEKRDLEESLNRSDDFTDEDMEAITAAEPFAQVIDENIAASEPAQTAERIERATSNLDVLKLLAEAAAQAGRQVDETVGQRLGSTPPTPSIGDAALAGVEQMRSTYPGWNEDTERMISEEIEGNPAVAEMVSRAVASGDSANVAVALSGAHAAVQTRHQARAEAAEQSLLSMKQNAQTMSGSQGRPERSSAADAE